MRQYITTLTIWASLLLAELHTFWENSTKEANWIWTKNVQMPVQWNIKYVTDEVWFILMALAILFYIPNRINKTTVTLTVLRVTLPIASNVGQTYEIGGTANDELGTPARISGNVANDVAEIRFTPVDVTNRTFSFVFVYKVNIL